MRQEASRHRLDFSAAPRRADPTKGPPPRPQIRRHREEGLVAGSHRLLVEALVDFKVFVDFEAVVVVGVGVGLYSIVLHRDRGDDVVDFALLLVGNEGEVRSRRFLVGGSVVR